MCERDSIIDVNVTVNEKNELLFSPRLFLNYLNPIFVASPFPSVFSLGNIKTRVRLFECSIAPSLPPLSLKLCLIFGAVVG